jgi:hypothetical protein
MGRMKGGLEMNKRINLFLLIILTISLTAPLAFSDGEGTEGTEGTLNVREKAWWAWDYDQGNVGVFSSVPEWLQKGMNFFGLGTSWAQLIVILAACLIIYAATFDILSFGSFSTPWVKKAIAVGITAVALVSKAIHWFAGFLVGLMGGSVVLATLLAIFFSAVFFAVGSWAKGKHKVAVIQAKTKLVGAASNLGAAGARADIQKAAAISDAADAVTKLG